MQVKPEVLLITMFLLFNGVTMWKMSTLCIKAYVVKDILRLIEQKAVISRSAKRP